MDKAIKHSADLIDRQVGQNMRRLRALKSMSQEKLGSALGLTFQQVQKYEKGTNRVSASRLVHIARILDVPILKLFEGIDLKNGKTETVNDVSQFLDVRGSIKFIRAVSKIEHPNERERLVKTCTSVVEQLGGG